MKKENKMIYIVIFILTYIDVRMTVWGVINNYIEEANPLFTNVMHNYPRLTGFSILILVGLLLFFLSKQKIKWLKYPLLGLIIIKIGIVFLHINWLLQI
jgi:hypothetical protein